MGLEEIRCISKLDEAVFEAALTDLKSSHIRSVRSAALYFFLNGAGIDEDSPRTFTALCERYNASPNFVAKQVWGLLTPERQKLVRELLAEAGCV